MSIARCREINARLRAAGITVYEWPDWETRGNGQSSAYEGGLVHHTGSDYGMALPGTGIGGVLVNGRPDLSGPLCNYAGNADGSMTLIAAHPANHAGASGGRSMGPLPVTTLFNKRVLGLEIVYPGSSPMRDAQYRSALVWSRVVTDVCGYSDIQRARAHAETSITGKWDPGDAPSRTINMVAFRMAAALLAEENDMPLSDADKIGIWSWPLRSAWDPNLVRRPDDWLSIAAGAAGNVEQALVTQVLPLLAQIAAAQAGEHVDAETLLARLEAASREGAAAGAQKGVAEVVLPALQRIEAALHADDADEATAIVTELMTQLAERLRPAA